MIQKIRLSNIHLKVLLKRLYIIVNNNQSNYLFTVLPFAEKLVGQPTPLLQDVAAIVVNTNAITINFFMRIFFY
jgi:hypothetical protein